MCSGSGEVSYSKFIDFCITQGLFRNVQRFRGGLVFKAHWLLHHSTLGLKVMNKKEKKRVDGTKLELNLPRKSLIDRSS